MAEGRQNGPLKMSYESRFGPSPKKFQGGHIEFFLGVKHHQMVPSQRFWGGRGGRLTSLDAS